MSTEARKVATHRRILAAAAEVFLEHGYEAASMDAIQRRAGGSKATLYAHFPSKEALFEAVLSGLDQGPLSLESILLGDGAAGALLRAVGGKVLQAACSPWYARLQRRVLERVEAAPGAAADFYARGPGRTQEMLAALLARLHRDGHLHCPQPQASAGAFLGQLQAGFGLQVLYGLPAPSQLVQRSWVRSCVRSFLDLHAPSRPPRRTS